MNTHRRTQSAPLMILLALAIVIVPVLALAPVKVVRAAGVVGDGTPESCTESALVDALAGGGLVTFDCGDEPVAITITTRKQVTGTTTIDGGGLVTLDGRGESRILFVTAGSTATIQNIAINNGQHTSVGAGIQNAGTLIVINSTFDNNHTTSNGGAISSNANTRLEIYGSTFTNNSAAWGGAIFIGQGDSVIEVEGSTFIENSADLGGAIYNHQDIDVTIDYSTFHKNVASANGGAIYNNQNLTASYHANTLTENSAAIGAGMYFHLNVDASIDSSTLAGNTASGGGGGLYVNADSNLDIVNSTFHANSSSVLGAAIRLTQRAEVTLISSTLTGHRSNNLASNGVIYNESGTVTISQSILVNDPNIFECSAFHMNQNPLVWGEYISEGYNIVSTPQGTELMDPCRGGGTGDIVVPKPPNDGVNLGELTLANGGPTPTRMPGVNSVAINKVPAELCLPVDQRLLLRPEFQMCDIGSVNTGAAAAPTIESVTNSGPIIEGETVEITVTLASGGDDVLFEFDCDNDSDYEIGPTPENTAICTFLDDGEYRVNAWVSNAVGQDDARTTVTVLNAAPVIHSISTQVNDFLVTVNVSASDPGVNDVLTYRFDCDGNLDYEVDNGTSNIAICDFGDQTGTFTINVEVQDGDGGEITGSTTVQIGPASEPPVIESVTNNGPVFEGSPVQITVNLASGTDVTYAFDCDNDGTYEVNPQPGNTTTCTFPDQGDYQVNARVSNADGTATEHTTVTVLNADPQIGNIETQVNGSQVTVTVSASDPSVNDVLTYRFDCDGDPDYEIDAGTSNTTTCDFGDQTGTFTINVEVQDGDGGMATGFTTVQIESSAVPPVIEDVTNSGPVDEGSPVQVAVTLSAGSDGATYSFDCNNDALFEIGPIAENTTSCTFADDGTYQVNVMVSNSDGTDTGSTSVTVLNVEPSIDDIATQVHGAQITVTVAASDPGINDVLTYRFDCDGDLDYEVDAGTSNTATCDFGSQTGTFTINVEVSDGDGGTATGFTTVEIGPVIPGSTLCADRLTGLVFAPQGGSCGSRAMMLEFPVAKNMHFCALALIGVLRVSQSGFCLPIIETRYTLPAAGPLTVCIHEPSRFVRLVSDRLPCLPNEVRRTIG